MADAEPFEMDSCLELIKVLRNDTAPNSHSNSSSSMHLEILVAQSWIKGQTSENKVHLLCDWTMRTADWSIYIFVLKQFFANILSIIFSGRPCPKAHQ